MGRAGGSHSSGSHSGGSHSSGGRSHMSGSGRSGSSSYSSSRYSGGSHTYHHTSSHRSSPTYRSYRNTTYYGGSTPTASGGGNMGLAGKIVVGIFIFFFVIILLVCCAAMFDSGSSSSSDITSSTVNREALTGTKQISNWYEDDIGDWVYDSKKMEKGLVYFYEKTGVQPYVIITDSVNGSSIPTNEECDAWLDGIYNKMMPDGGHMILAFIENSNGYMEFYYCGSTAKSVFDDEAANILFDYLDRYYTDSSLDTEEYFSTAFIKTADRMMDKSTTKEDVANNGVKGIIVIAVLVIAFIFWRKYKEQKNIEAEHRRKILETPLGNFDVDEDLAKKYGESTSDSENKTE